MDMKVLAIDADRTRIVPLMMVTYFLQSYDKGIMSAATQFGFNEDLGLTTVIGYNSAGEPITDNHKYANASMIFYVGYLVGTYPMMYLSQRYPSSRVISVAVFLWGAVVLSTAGCFSYTGIMLNRFFLGFLESTVAPAFTVLVTFWWTREEQALRTNLWYCCVGVATIISPLVNYGLGQIHGPLAPWKPMFLIIGAVTVCWSVVLFIALPDTPLTSRHLTEAERAIALRRLERNNAGTVTHVFNKAQFFEAFRDYKMYSSVLVILLTGVPSGALGTFGTIVINGFGFSHFDSLALTCPIGAITAICILLVGYIARKRTGTRYLSIVVTALISIAGLLICWFGPRSNRGLLFAGIFLVAVQVAAGGQAVSLAASNIAGHTSEPAPVALRLPTLQVVPGANPVLRRREIHRQCVHVCRLLRRQHHRASHLRCLSRSTVSFRIHREFRVSVCSCWDWNAHRYSAANGKQEARPTVGGRRCLPFHR